MFLVIKKGESEMLILESSLIDLGMLHPIYIKKALSSATFLARLNISYSATLTFLSSYCSV